MQNYDEVYVTKSLFMKQDKGGAVVGIRGTLLGAIARLKDGEELIIGRDPAACALVIDKSIVSRKHCSVRYHRETKMYSVWDWSKNGTFRSNGQRLERGCEYRFPPGEELLIGDGDNIVKLG